MSILSNMRDSLKAGSDKEKLEAADALLLYVEGLLTLEQEIRRLHQASCDALIYGSLDETQKGHRQGMMEVCELLMKLF